jgi:hypothetical protein
MSKIMHPVEAGLTGLGKRSAHPRPRTAQALPEYAMTYFNNLTGEYRSLPPTVTTPEITKIVDEIQSKSEKQTLTWQDLYTFDLVLARLQPVKKLPRVIWSLRSRYRDVVGQPEYDAYLASKPSDPTGAPAEQEWRADIEYLLNELHLRYAMLPLREKLRNGLSKWVTSIIIVGIIWVMVFIFLINRSVDGIVHLFDINIPIGTATFTVVLFVGAMGGLVSMQQRFHSVSDEGDPVNTVAKLNYAWFSIFESPISGAIFAGVLYLSIIGGLMQGALFPAISKFSAGSPFVTLGDFLQRIGPASGEDYAKLILWSFIAGFAERLVPDTLSRFISKSEADQGAKK